MSDELLAPLTPYQAAALFGVGERHVRQQISDGRLPGQRVGNRIMVNPTALVERYAKDATHPLLAGQTLQRLRERAARVGYPLDEQVLVDAAGELLRKAPQLNSATAKPGVRIRS